MFGVKEINYFIQQRHINLIKSGSRDIYVTTSIKIVSEIINAVLFFFQRILSIHQRILKTFIILSTLY